MQNYKQRPGRSQQPDPLHATRKATTSRSSVGWRNGNHRSLPAWKKVVTMRKEEGSAN